MSPTQQIAVYDPDDGTVIDLEQHSTGLLAHLVLGFKEREQRYRQMRELVERELMGRVQDGGRKIVLVEGLELKIEYGRGRVWDPDELEHAVRELVDQGTLHAGELTGLITRETKVDGKLAQRLLGALHGPALERVETCFRWEKKSRPRLSITPSLPLLTDQES